MGPSLVTRGAALIKEEDQFAVSEDGQMEFLDFIYMAKLAFLGPRGNRALLGYTDGKITIKAFDAFMVRSQKP